MGLDFHVQLFRLDRYNQALAATREYRDRGNAKPMAAFAREALSWVPAEDSPLLESVYFSREDVLSLILRMEREDQGPLGGVRGEVMQELSVACLDWQCGRNPSLDISSGPLGFYLRTRSRLVEGLVMGTEQAGGATLEHSLGAASVAFSSAQRTRLEHELEAVAPPRETIAREGLETLKWLVGAARAEGWALLLTLG
jgi:hypothetical protein